MNRYSPNSILVNLLLLLVALPGLSYGQPAKQLPYWRPYDMRGINVFETGKQDTVEYDGPDLRWGAAFTQQFQALDHENAADEVIVDGVNRNQLMEIGNGFNLATANLYLDALLAEGIRVNLITYLSSRHHPEAWVKGGFFQVDRLPMFKSDFLDNIMDYVTLRIGHFEINYGDAHLRRTDNGNALYNPLVGNYIMDAYTTEIGGEVYVQSNGFLGMLGMTDGEIQGNVTRPDDRSPSIYGKLGFDRQLQPDLRLRLTGSFYTTASSINNTLYGGDRAGSRYYLVMENTTATISSNFTSGRINPGRINHRAIVPPTRRPGIPLAPWNVASGIADKKRQRSERRGRKATIPSRRHRLCPHAHQRAGAQLFPAPRSRMGGVRRHVARLPIASRRACYPWSQLETGR